MFFGHFNLTRNKMQTAATNIKTWTTKPCVVHVLCLLPLFAFYFLLKCLMIRFLCKFILSILTFNFLRYLYAVPFRPRDNMFGEEFFYERRAGIQDQLSTAYTLKLTLWAPCAKCKFSLLVLAHLLCANWENLSFSHDFLHEPWL